MHAVGSTRGEFVPGRTRRPYDNLPRPLTRFVGRESQVADLFQLIRDVRILTLTGAGGSGKTRLAIEVASRAATDFEDGACWVDIAPLEDPALVAATLARALSVPESMVRTRTEGLQQFLRDKKLLILLDNCEHQISTCAELATGILETCADVRILATSREPLAIGGESIWVVPPLSLPAAAVADARIAAGAEAVQLFVDRATHQQPAFRLTDDNAPAIVEICRRLDGLPLAIELASARVRLLSPDQIANALEDRFAVLATAPRTAARHHRTLEASIDWSYESLSEQAARVLRRLSVFAGSFSFEAGQGVAADDGLDSPAVLDLMSELVEKSLVGVEASRESARYRLLETVRRYAARKLAESGEERTVKAKHLNHFVELSELAGPQLEGHGHAEWLARLEPDLDNLRAAMDWGADQGRIEPALRIAESLWAFWSLGGHLREAVDRLTALLESAEVDDQLRSKGLVGAAWMARWLGALPTAWSFASQALELGRRSGDERTICRSLAVVGFVESFASVQRGVSLFEEAKEVASKIGDPIALADSLTFLGNAEIAAGNLDKAHSLAEESVGVARAGGNIFGLSRALSCRGMAALYQGSFSSAEATLRECWELGPVGGDSSWVVARGFLAVAASWQGDHEKARGLLDEARSIVAELDNPFVTAFVNMLAARAEAAGGDLAAADTHADEAIGFFRPVGMKGLLGLSLTNKGDLAQARGDEATARACWEECATVARDMGSSWLLARSLQGQARLAQATSEVRQAVELLHEALGLLSGSGHTLGIVDALEDLAGIIIDGRDFAEAARLLGAATACRERIGYVQPYVYQGAYIAHLSNAREALGPEDFSRAWREGQAMTLEGALAYASRGRGRRLRPSAGWASLTPTELDVVRLISEGMSNPVIAEKLFLARSTVKTHLLHIFAKLGVTSRAELAALAARRTK